MKLLLVEDDSQLAEYLCTSLSRDGYTVEWANNGVDGEHLGLEEHFDGIVLDLGLPQKPGLEVLRNWRSKPIRTPVLILTARDSWQERVDGLKAGADDYLGKPFHYEELSARLQAVLRRQFGKADNILKLGDLELNSDTRIVLTANGVDSQLTAIEFKLLRYLMLHPDKIISKSELSEILYDDDNLKDSNVIEVYINRLRSILGKSRITTFRGQGYRLGH
jgi:DNA-binding response OmpR family regulator